MSGEQRKKIRKTLQEKGIRPPVVRYWKGKTLTKDHRLKIAMAGMREKNPAWKGGITKENKRIRESIEYYLWREAVFKRDSYTCVWCGRVGVRIEADHIKPFAEYPELRFAIDNGRTLCHDCHTKTDTYGYRGKRLSHNRS